MRTEDLLTGTWRIPVFTLTGFLGSGKTSLLVRLLREPPMARTAIIVNEFGDAGIDQLTLRQVDDNVRLLEHGCLCCTTRADLLETLRGLYIDRLRSDGEPFERIVIETSGMADPIPVLHTLMVDPLLQERFACRGTLVTVDLLQPVERLLERAEGARQAAAADTFVFTKHDLPGACPPRAARQALRRVNPDADVCTNGDAEVATLAATLAAERLDTARPRHPPTEWMLDTLARARSVATAVQPAEEGTLRPVHRPSPVESFVLRTEQPIAAAAMSGWLQRLVADNASRLLRLKGVVEVLEQADLVVVHAVRHLFHPVTSLARPPGDPGGMRLVLIIDNPQRLPRRQLGIDVLGPSLFERCEAGAAAPITAFDVAPA